MIKQIAFTVILFFAFVGVLITGNLIHEFSHAQDFKDYAHDGVYSFLIVPDLNQGFLEIFKSAAIAKYSFQYSKNDILEVEKINNYTENKAYSLNAIVFVVFIFSLIILLESSIIKISSKMYSFMLNLGRKEKEINLDQISLYGNSKGNSLRTIYQDEGEILPYVSTNNKVNLTQAKLSAF